jgi:hypothetical protein
MTHQSHRRWLRPILLAVLTLAVLTFFPLASPTAAKETSVQIQHRSPGDGTTQDYVRVLQSDAWLRFMPSTSSGVIRIVHAGRGFHVYEEQGDWCKGYSAEDPFAVGWIPCYHLYY